MNQMEKAIKDLANETKKSIAEVNKAIKELSKDTKKAISDLSKENEKAIRNFRKQMEENGTGNGNMAESFFIEATEDGFRVNGIREQFKQIETNLKVFVGNKHQEIDILLGSNSSVFIIEVKYNLKKDKKLFQKMEDKIFLLKKKYPKVTEGKEILTAFAVMGVRKQVRDFFTSAGHFVFTAQNEKLQIYPPTKTDCRVKKRPKKN